MKVLNSNGGELQPAVCTAKKSELVFILEAGHSSVTPGKRSPDGRLREYAYNREILQRVGKQLDKLGIKWINTVPEVDKEISLSERAARVNKLCEKYGKANCIFISLHSNAGPGEWTTANGWECYTTKGHNNSDDIAEIFADEAKKVCTKLHKTYRGKKEENWTVIYKAVCRSILVESFFYNNKTELEWMLSEEGKSAISEIIVNSIKRIALA